MLSTLPSDIPMLSTKISPPCDTNAIAGDLSHGRATSNELTHLTSQLSSEPTTLSLLSLSHNTLFPDHVENLFHTIAHTSHIHTISMIQSDATHIGDIGVASVCAAIVGNGTGMTHQWGAPQPIATPPPVIPVTSPPSKTSTVSNKNKEPSITPTPIITYDPFLHHPDAHFLNLHTLSLSACHLTQSSIPLVSRLLRIDRHLLHLNIAHNPGVTDITEIGHALSTENTTLISLDVSFCSIASDGIRALTHAIQHHSTLLACHIIGNIHTHGDTQEWEIARQALDAAIEENRYARVRIVKLAFAMGLHPRIGVFSSVRTLLPSSNHDSDSKHELIDAIAPMWEYLGQV